MAGVLSTTAGSNKPSAPVDDPFGNPSAINIQDMAGTPQQATTYTPPNEALVSGQLTRILSQDSPYIQQARASAQQYANRRGLMNSSIAATAGESAAIERALPIAQQDAQTYDVAGRFNAESQNTFARDANTFGREAALRQYQGILDTGRARADYDLRNRDLQQQGALRGRELDIRQQELDANRGVEDQRQRQELMRTLSNIRTNSLEARLRLESDPNMTADAKREAIIALSAQARQDMEEAVRFSGLTLPDAWPTWINQLTPLSGYTPPAPAPAPEPPYVPPESTGGDGTGGVGGF